MELREFRDGKIKSGRKETTLAVPVRTGTYLAFMYITIFDSCSLRHMSLGSQTVTTSVNDSSFYLLAPRDSSQHRSVSLGGLNAGTWHSDPHHYSRLSVSHVLTMVSQTEVPANLYIPRYNPL